MINLPVELADHVSIGNLRELTGRGCAEKSPELYRLETENDVCAANLGQSESAASRYKTGTRKAWLESHEIFGKQLKNDYSLL